MSAARLPGPATAVLRLVLAATLLLLVLMPMAPASAHSELVFSTPADGARVAAVPPTVLLTFNEEINPTFVQVVVAGADGQGRPMTAATAGPKVTVALPATLGAGRIEVRYRVVSKDGHPIAGEIAFTVATGAAAGSSSSAAVSAPATSNSAPSAASAAPTGMTSGPVAESTETATTDRGVSGAVYGLIVLVTLSLTVLGAGLLLFRRGRRRQKTQV